MKENELYILPSPSEDMRKFISLFKIDMMEHVISSIKFAVENRLPIVEVFQFKDSPFVVTINEREFEPNLTHISDYYKQNEMYELYPRVEELREILKRKTNEKESSEDRNGPNSDSK